ncbi:hypothetical protein [Embleya sp. NPDC020886]
MRVDGEGRYRQHVLRIADDQPGDSVDERRAQAQVLPGGEAEQ